jgi:SAM-dependent methyltransferase
MNDFGHELYTGSTYASSNPTWHDEDAEWKASQIWKLLARNHCIPRHVVDVGCGAGGVLSSLLIHLPAGSDGVGFDIAPYAISMAEKRHKQNIEFLCVDFIASDQTGFDLLLCIDVFEHVEDYIGFLKKIRDRSEFFVFHIPLDMSVKGLLQKLHMKERKNVGHIHYFDYLTALAVLEDCGYTVVDRFYTCKPSTRPNNGLIPKAKSAARNLITIAKGNDFTVQLLGGESLMVFARADH